MKNWVLVLQGPDLSKVGKIRCWPGMQAAELKGQLWLRCPMQQAELEGALRCLPALYTYREDEQGLLFREGQLTPSTHLPKLNWTPLTEYIPVELPTAALPAMAPNKYAVKLIPLATAQNGVGLKITLEKWQQYAETTPAIRLECLHFALSEMGEVMLLGEPLPPIPGEEFWQRGSVLLPAGYDLEWPIVAELLNARENGEGLYYLVFDREGNWEKIGKECFVPATRAGIRLSKLSST